MYYKPKYFGVKELVPFQVYRKWGEEALRFLDAGLLHDLDIIREAVGVPMVVNNAVYNWSGLRTSDWESYSATSAHSFGMAVDIKLLPWLKGDLTISWQDVIDLIKQLKKEGKLLYINRMELGTINPTPWVHIDTCNMPPNDISGLYLFNS